ncbi:hypothetical protein CBL_02768 [Carabus blaptoides fortunei]
MALPYINISSPLRDVVRPSAQYCRRAPDVATRHTSPTPTLPERDAANLYEHHQSVRDMWIARITNKHHNTASHRFVRYVILWNKQRVSQQPESLRNLQSHKRLRFPFLSEKQVTECPSFQHKDISLGLRNTRLILKSRVRPCSTQDFRRQ